MKNRITPDYIKNQNFFLYLFYKTKKGSKNFIYTLTMKATNTNMTIVRNLMVNITLCNIRPNEGSCLFVNVA